MYQFQFGRESECVFSEIPEIFYLILRQILYFSGTTCQPSPLRLLNTRLQFDFFTRLITSSISTNSENLSWSRFHIKLHIHTSLVKILFFTVKNTSPFYFILQFCLVSISPFNFALLFSPFYFVFYFNFQIHTPFPLPISFCIQIHSRLHSHVWWLYHPTTLHETIKLPWDFLTLPQCSETF